MATRLTILSHQHKQVRYGQLMSVTITDALKDRIDCVSSVYMLGYAVPKNLASTVPKLDPLVPPLRRIKLPSRLPSP